MVQGLIPAHAGKTGFKAGDDRASGAHPRSRGENRRRWLAHEIAMGSSPLTRGKHAIMTRAYEGGGLIPAHAGKTSGSSACSRTRRAHPRSRGENRAFYSWALDARGSSPLTRGKPWAQIKAAVSVGLIPAHAGKTARPRLPTSQARAHPRSRGENLAFVVPIVLVGGSSPLTRGKRRGQTFS